MSSVGRVKLNSRIGSKLEESYGELSMEDILSVIDIIVNLKNGIGEYDDIDHLGNRRVRSVGELVENQFRTGLVRMERASNVNFKRVFWKFSVKPIYGSN